MPEWLSVMGSFGSMAAALTVAWFALQYIRERDKQIKELVARVDMIASRFETKLSEIADKFDRTIRDIQGEHRQTYQALFTLQRETVSALGDIKTELVALRQEVRSTENKIFAMSAAQQQQQTPTPGIIVTP